MALSAKCMALRGVSKNLLAAQCTFSPSIHLLTRSSKKVLTPRCLSTQSINMPTDAGKSSTLSPDIKDGFITIYKLPAIRYLATINRVKFHQTILVSAVVPFCSVLSSTGHFPVGAGWVAGAVGLIICSTLYSLSYFCTNMIGFIYVSVDGSTVKIAYIDKWGKRKEDTFPSDDLIPISELKPSFLDELYYKLRRYSDSDSHSLYKMHVKHARITDRDRFSNLFGKVDI